MYTIATLHQLKAYLGVTDSGDDARLLAALQAAAIHLERLAGRQFCPRQATVAHDITDTTTLVLVDDLLVLDSVTDTTVIDDVLVLPGSVLKLTGGRTFIYTETPLQAVEVAGTWGWHDDWATAWRDSGDSVAVDPLSATATTITVGDATAVDSANEAPRFHVGHLLKIGTEYLRVLAVTETALTVLRGVRGTTAAEHALDTAIHTYQPPQDVVSLHVRLAAWLYKSPDARANGIPTALLREIDPLRRVRV